MKGLVIKHIRIKAQGFFWEKKTKHLYLSAKCKISLKQWNSSSLQIMNMDDSNKSNVFKEIIFTVICVLAKTLRIPNIICCNTMLLWISLILRKIYNQSMMMKYVKILLPKWMLLNLIPEYCLLGKWCWITKTRKKNNKSWEITRSFFDINDAYF